MTRNNDKIDEWQERAEENTDKWGVQPPVDVVLAMVEEIAEITEEIIENSETKTDIRSTEERELMYLFVEVTVLGEKIRESLEETYEDELGNPVPEEQRPRILGEITDSEPVERELDDLGPLVIQLAESIDEYSKW